MRPRRTATSHVTDLDNNRGVQPGYGQYTRTLQTEVNPRQKEPVMEFTDAR